MEEKLEELAMSTTHILAIPFPAQGHVIPLMELSHELVKHGIKVTFVNTDFTHNQIMRALGEKGGDVGNEIQLVSIPDGLEDGENRTDFGKLTEAMCEVMPKKLEILIEEINKSVSSKITCVVADESFGWALEVAKKMRIRRVAFWPASASMLALNFSIQKLLDDGIMTSDGEIMHYNFLHMQSIKCLIGIIIALQWNLLISLKVLSLQNLTQIISH